MKPCALISVASVLFVLMLLPSTRAEAGCSPAATITSPADGSTVSGTITISADICSYVASVSVYIDGKFLASSAVASFSWDTTTVPDGSHKISVRSFNSSGSQIATATATVTTANGLLGNCAAPAVITSPADGSTVAGTVNISAQLCYYVSYVKVYVDGNYLATSPPPLSYPWVSARVPNGSHKISVRSFNSSGSQIANAVVTVTTANPLHLSAPRDGSAVWTSVTVTAAVTVDVASVVFYVDGTPFASGPPYSATWNSASVPDGQHIISATAYDSAQSPLGSDSVTVSVVNDATAFSTTTPIKHLVVIFAENHSFDNIFATYQPPAGQTVLNLLSEGIVTAEGTPGPNYALAAQQEATDSDVYSINPQRTGPYVTLPQPNTTNAIGQPNWVPDTRFPTALANGPFQITEYVPYPNAFVGDPVHRFFQMWQQVSEGAHDLYVWTAETASNGPQSPSGMPTPSPGNSYQGALSMGYYNISAGDEPDILSMVTNYALADNYHQPVMGGTGANTFFLLHDDLLTYLDLGGNTIPPSSIIENPDPQTGTNNFYTQDGLGGGSYVNCSDLTQPGVSAIMNYLNSLPYTPFNGGNCAPGLYYQVNNMAVGSTPSIAHVNSFLQALAAAGISVNNYSGGTGTTQLYSDLANNALPAVSFVEPSGKYDGHPAHSAESLFESFATQLINTVISNPSLWATTAFIVTTDESGGYFDSGYVQPIDFFGDGPRIPAIAISPYAKQGYVDHTYYDHASIGKFIEENWGLPPLSSRSRDNLPNPTPSADPYVPANRPAIGDLMGLFDFSHFRADAPPIS